MAVNRLMAQMLVGTYFALTGVVCLNLYIALLSDTFSRVYAQAQANAVMQQAQLVLLVEKSLPKKKKVKFGHYMKSECGPLVRFGSISHLKGDDGLVVIKKIAFLSPKRVPLVIYLRASVTLAMPTLVHSKPEDWRIA